MKKIVDGNIACSDISYLFTEVASIYPITPSSPMSSNIDNLANVKNKSNIFNDKVTLVEMQSEAGAAGALHGALVSGSLATTYTSSQGLLLMIPNMYKIAGEGLPGVIHVAARTVATHALSIFGDHSDVYATRSTGFAILASTNQFDAQNLAAVAHLSAIKASVPFLHFFDGFRTSHEINTIEGINEEKLLELVDYDKINEFKKNALNVDCGYQRGMAENEDIYFQSMEARSYDYINTVEVVNDYMESINKIMNTSYKPFNYYGSNDATSVIVAMGSVCDTIKEVIDSNPKYGLIEVHLYRPFSTEYLLKEIPSSVKKIAVLDRTKEMGSAGEPLYLDVVSSLKDTKIKVYGGRYGLSSKDTTPSQILSVFEMLDNKPVKNFTIGINDDIYNKSLNEVSFNVDSNDKEILIYGYGSDGMVSASKDILKIIGNKTSKYVQGYFKYDSKKSGGVTISNLRIGDKPIRKPYYVNKCDLLVITKDVYLNNFDMISKLKDNSTLLINTSKSIEDLIKMISNKDKEIINEKNIRFLIIDANKIAMDNNISGKISKIMEVVILKLLEYDNALDDINESINKAYLNKGKNIVDANLNAVKQAMLSVKIIDKKLPLLKDEDTIEENIYDIINHGKGDSLKVSDVIRYKNGIFPCGLSKDEKRIKSDLVPKWISDNCIQCGMCSLVCPHAVIRPFVTESRGIPYIGKDGLKYEILISEDDCTSCGLCINTCPGKNGNKALSFDKRDNKDKEYVDKMFNDYVNPNVSDKFNVKGSQLQKPYFEFSGACAGCGETPYIKLLTQLFGKSLVIANATGCSSIYGGSCPSTPYNIPWANSLFEDNAEFGYGIKLSYNKMRNRINKIIDDSYNSVDKKVKSLYDQYRNHQDDFDITYAIKDELMEENIPDELRSILSYLPKRSVWIIGGDGWAYDIGFGGIDHILSTGEDINILVLDTEVYSNTGGQASKSSHIAQVAEFANMGKKTYKKDLFKIAMNYPNTYVGNVSLGYNFMQTIKVFKEAEEHKGPSIIICYCPCQEHGIKGGMSNSINEEKLAVECGYTTLMHYNPEEDNLYIDSREPDFTKYKDFLMNEVRYRSLINKDPEAAKRLLAANLKESKKRYEDYIKLSKK